MKKSVICLLVISVLLSVFVAFAYANAPVTIYVNENVLQCETAPFIHNGRTMVPMRKIFEAYGASVDWNGETRTVTANTGTTEIKLVIGDYTLYSNGVAETMDVAPMIVNDTTFIPVRAVSQSLGLTVEWLEDTQSVYINSPVAFDMALDGKPVITVNGNAYSQADYNLIYMSMYQQAAQTYSVYFGEAWESLEVEKGKTAIDMLKEDAAMQLVQIEAIRKIAEEKGIFSDADSEKFADEKIAYMIEALGGEAQFKAFLTEMKTTEKALRRYYEFYEISGRVQEKITQPGQEAYVDAAALQKEFAENYWTVQHILVSNEGRTEEEAIAIVNEIYAKLKKGASFESLIEKYNEDPGMTKNSFYTFTAGYMVPEFEENSKLLKIGEYSAEAVKTSYGYHIIKKYETDLKSEEFNNYVMAQKQEIIADLIQKKAESLTIEIKN